MQTIDAIGAMLATRDPYTSRHQRRVAELARLIAGELDLPASGIEGVHASAMLHDIGKIYVPAEILSTPNRLREIEFNIIKVHPTIGHDILRAVEFPWPVAGIVVQHHERVDGTGYPRGLRGPAIFLEARIVSVADVVEAMASHRPYRPALGIDRSLEEIVKNRGILYDADVVDACCRVFRKDFTFSEHGFGDELAA